MSNTTNERWTPQTWAQMVIAACLVVHVVLQAYQVLPPPFAEPMTWLVLFGGAGVLVQILVWLGIGPGRARRGS